MTVDAFGFPSQPTPEQIKVACWYACREIPDYDGRIWRWDCHGHVIRWGDYGDRSSDYGWELDHIVATALGGSNHPSNFRALHWRANAGLGGALGALLNNKVVGSR